jgi:predicted nucleic acid-binding Zn ribbon protein
MQRKCSVCETPFTPPKDERGSKKLYCSNRCKQVAAYERAMWRRVKAFAKEKLGEEDA